MDCMIRNTWGHRRILPEKVFPVQIRNAHTDKYVSTKKGMVYRNYCKAIPPRAHALQNQESHTKDTHI
jgi:hypothetical protein